MGCTVQLEKIVDALQMQTDEYSAYLNVDTGEVETLPNELIADAGKAGEDAEEPSDRVVANFDVRDWEIAKRIAFTDRFIALPDKFDVHEWEIMRDFASAQKEGRVRDELLRALHGSGAFRHFKSTLHRHELERDWYGFRDSALRQIAIDWCEANELAWK